MFLKKRSQNYKDYIFKIIYIISIIFQVCSTEGMANVTKKALIFGGNGFIGSEAVLKLNQEGYKITCVSRGNWYWDSELRIKPLVNYIVCDRKEGLKNCPEFLDLLKTDSKFDVVIDFSGYKPEVVKDSTDLLKKFTELYIYISTDSVYEVSKIKENPEPNKEEDAVRPSNPEEQKKLNKLDSYGHKKLSCEEVLEDQLKSGGIPFIIFRLPDVIGPRDTTDRFWVYQLWVQFYHFIQQPLMVPPKTLNLFTSYVYVKDVAEGISLALKNLENCKNQIFNLGFQEAMTLEKILYDMKEYLQVDNIEFNYEDTPSSFYLFPSVTRGSVNISKAKNLLKWVPTSWKQALEETVEFYRTALKEFPIERKEAIDTLLAYVVSHKQKKSFLKAVDEQTKANIESFNKKAKLEL